MLVVEFVRRKWQHLALQVSTFNLHWHNGTSLRVAQAETERRQAHLVMSGGRKLRGIWLQHRCVHHDCNRNCLKYDARSRKKWKDQNCVVDSNVKHEMATACCTSSGLHERIPPRPCLVEVPSPVRAQVRRGSCQCRCRTLA